MRDMSECHVYADELFCECDVYSQFVRHICCLFMAMFGLLLNFKETCLNAHNCFKIV